MAVDSTTSVEQLKQLGLYQEKKSGPTQELGQDQFLDLMLAQMKHQDPLEPMENTEFISQLAQFSTSQGIAELKGSFETFSASMQSNQALQASTLVGRGVVVPSDKLVIGEEQPGYGKVDLPSSTTNLRIGIYDTAGQLVHESNLGAHPEGAVEFSWDGVDAEGNTYPPGTYSLKAEAFFDGELQAIETYAYAPVQSVDLRGTNGISLNLAGYGTKDFSDVREII